MPIIIFLSISLVSLFAIDETNQLLHNAKNLLDNNKTTKAITIYNKLDEDNVVEASYNLGMIYGYGINGIEKQQQIAIKYLTKASLKHHKKAPYYLSLLLTTVKDRNETKIKMLMLESAVSGFDKAQLELGKLLLNDGKIEYAKEWINKARKQENSKAEMLWNEIKEVKY